MPKMPLERKWGLSVEKPNMIKDSQMVSGSSKMVVSGAKSISLLWLP